MQLSMIPNLIKTAYADNIKVTNVRTIADAMIKSEIYKGMLNEVDKLLDIFYISCCKCNRRKILFLSL